MSATTATEGPARSRSWSSAPSTATTSAASSDCRRPGQTVVGDEAVVGSGGKGANQAVAASLAGARTVMVGCVGDDPDGAALVGGLRQAGVDVRGVQALADVRTGMAFVLVAADGENCIAVAPGANSRLRADDAVAPSAPAGAAGGPGHPGGDPEATFCAVVTAAAERGCRAVVNLAPFRPVPDDVLALCDPLVVNESEAGALLGRSVHGADEAAAAAASCSAASAPSSSPWAPRARCSPSRAVSEHVPTPRTEVVDTTGAGDAFTGALAAALSRGEPLAAAVRLGVRAGAHSVARPGAQSSYATLAELGH